MVASKILVLMFESLVVESDFSFSGVVWSMGLGIGSLLRVPDQGSEWPQKFGVLSIVALSGRPGSTDNHLACFLVPKVAMAQPWASPML